MVIVMSTYTSKYRYLMHTYGRIQNSKLFKIQKFKKLGAQKNKKFPTTPHTVHVRTATLSDLFWQYIAVFTTTSSNFQRTKEMKNRKFFSMTLYCHAHWTTNIQKKSLLSSDSILVIDDIEDNDKKFIKINYFVFHELRSDR